MTDAASIRQFSTTRSSNAAVAGINTTGTGNLSQADDTFREIMGQIAEWLVEMSYPTVGGTADALTLTPTTALAALADKVVYTGKAASTNATTTPTMKVSATTAKVIRKIVGGTDVALAAGDIQANGRYNFVYSTAANSAGGAWILLGEPKAFPDGTVALPAMRFHADPDSGMYRIGANNIGIGVNGAKVLDIGTGGLGVTGTLATTDNLTITKAAPRLFISKTAGNDAFIEGQTAGSTRARLRLGNSTAESGSNVGSDVDLLVFDDSAGFLFTAWSVKRSTGAMAMRGTQTNDDASSGQVGEFIESEVLTASAVSLTTGTTANVTSISLTAGDWDVTGNIVTKPASGTTTTIINAGLSATSATFDTVPSKGGYTRLNMAPGSFATTGDQALQAGVRRFSLASTTTIYLLANVTFGTSTMAAYGYIRARRAR